MRWAALLALTFAACSRQAPEETPEGVVRLWLEKMEEQDEDPRAAREAFALLGPSARANLEQRAERASRMMGRRVEPHEMLAEGRFGLKFRPKTMTSHVTGDRATVDVLGADPAERATVVCARGRSAENRPAWRVEPELPEPPAPPPPGPRN
jgi:hypothetical protein